MKISTNTNTTLEIKTAYTYEGAWKIVRSIARDYEYDAEISETTGINTYRFTVTATKTENAGVIIDRGDEIEVRICFAGRRWEVLRIRVATESEIEDILDELQRENEDLKAQIAELKAEAERAEAWNIAQQMTIANHSRRGW